jgi:hypothetical protein
MTKVHPAGAPFLCLPNASVSAFAETGRNQVKPIEYSPPCREETGVDSRRLRSSTNAGAGSKNRCSLAVRHGLD